MNRIFKLAVKSAVVSAAPFQMVYNSVAESTANFPYLLLSIVMEDHNSGTTQLVVLPGPWISIPKNPSRQITSSDTTCALIDDMMAVPCPMYGRCKI